MKKMLLVFAHPDDESFFSAGTVAKYVARGWQADLISATRGEAGSRGSLTDSVTPLGEIRQKELEAAGAIIGLSSIVFLGYHDGTLSNLNAGELEDKVYREMKKYRPDVVITFETTYGISNHPDHNKIGLAATFAFQKYAGETENPRALGRRAVQKLNLEEALTTVNLPKLYYVCLPESIVEFLKKEHILPSVSLGSPWSGVPDNVVTTVIDIKKYRNKKIKALRAHPSRSADVERLLSYEKVPVLNQEYLILRMEGTKEVFMGKNDRVSDRL